MTCLTTGNWKLFEFNTIRMWSFFLSFLEPAKIPTTDIIAQVESTVKDISKDEADTIRPKTSFTLQLQQSEPPRRNLTKEKFITILPSR